MFTVHEHTCHAGKALARHFQKRGEAAKKSGNESTWMDGLTFSVEPTKPEGGDDAGTT